MSTNLGDRMRENAERAAERREAERAAEERRKSAALRETVERTLAMLGKAREGIAEAAELGESEFALRMDRGSTPLGRDFRHLPPSDPTHPAHGEWKAFEEWAEAEGLHVEFTEDHDGMGMESWLTLRAGPALGLRPPGP